MLETRLKITFLIAVLLFAGMPLAGILRGTTPTPKEDIGLSSERGGDGATLMVSGGRAADTPVAEEMVLIPAGPFTRGTMAGGYDEKPEHIANLHAYDIDRFEVTSHQYEQFRAAVGHRKPSPPSRYARNLARMRGPNQPAVYVSWEDADTYCRWKGKRLPTEAEWEKAMRGTDGRLWPWGNENDPRAANYARVDDGYDVTAPVGSFRKDVSPYGVFDGAGNVMEWVADWYGESIYRDGGNRDPRGPSHGVFKVMRGGGYSTSGSDLRITSRSKMVPNFRDETIGFRCAKSAEEGQGKRGPERLKPTEVPSDREA